MKIDVYSEIGWVMVHKATGYVLDFTYHRLRREAVAKLEYHSGRNTQNRREYGCIKVAVAMSPFNPYQFDQGRCKATVRHKRRPRQTYVCMRPAMSGADFCINHAPPMSDAQWKRRNRKKC